ncbi:MAG TPA: hypothetical protein DC049_19050 [Spirochaetia bacterium]|nr:hypothetical protein [Spirochaetia bacterium]
MKKYRGGLTEESDAKKFIGKFITVYKHEYVSVISTLKSPKYKINEVNVSIEEGIVPSALQRQVSTFYGYKIERKKILLFEIYDTSDGEESKYSHCEVLDNDTLLFSYDGWWIFTKRQSK